jgi:hypothetical protein
MRRILLAVAVLMAGGVGAETPEVPEAIQPSEKIELFNGKDLSGWKVFLPGAESPKSVFQVSNGDILCTGSPNGYIRTEKRFKNYKLTVEWRFLTPGNSGILLHAQLPDKVWPKCIESQGLFEHQGDFWLLGGSRINELGPHGNHVASKEPSNEKPLREWNTYEIICSGDTIVPIVNGKEMNRGTGATVTEGHICIQSEGAEWACRKVTLEPLSAK